jgi:divalent metal cation (Fe/Co/Zn/Cd) transporter
VSTAEVAVPGSPAYLRETRKAKLLSWASLGYMAFEGIVAVAAGIVAASIALAASSLVLMPPLGRAKHRIGSRIGSSATASEGKQNLLCAYLAAALLVGLLGNALFGAWWLDPIVGLLIAAVAIQEGREAWRGDACCAH